MSTKLASSRSNEVDIIPFTKDLLIYRSGIIMDSMGKRLSVFKKRSGYFVNLPIADTHIVVNVATLTSIVFKGYKLPWEWWTQIKLFFKDDNPFNVHPDNIIHQMYPKHFVYEFEGVKYKIIPNFTRYGISKCGEVFNSENGQLHRRTIVLGEYANFKLCSDLNGAIKTVYRHRALCVTHKRYGKGVDKLNVNHINGIKGDDDLDNLEWVTSAENSHHALEVGLVPNTRRFFSLDINTGEVKRWRSLNHCADTLNVDRLTIYAELRNKAITQVLSPHHRYAYDDGEEIVWPSTMPTRSDMIRRGTLKLLRDNEVVWEGLDFKALAESKYGGKFRNVYLRRFKRLACPRKNEHLSVVDGFRLEIHLGKYVCDGRTITDGENVEYLEFKDR